MDAVVRRLDSHGLNIKPLCGRRLITDFDGGEELLLPDGLLGLYKLELRVLVAWIDLAACLEVLYSLLWSQASSVGDSAAIVGLGTSELADQPSTLPLHNKETQTNLNETWVELDSFGSVGNSISVCFGLQIGLREKQGISHASTA